VDHEEDLAQQTIRKGFDEGPMIEGLFKQHGVDCKYTRDSRESVMALLMEGGNDLLVYHMSRVVRRADFFSDNELPRIRERFPELPIVDILGGPTAVTYLGKDDLGKNVERTATIGYEEDMRKYGLAGIVGKTTSLQRMVENILHYIPGYQKPDGV
jgi:hypothetical protein